jgi:hypothetical protein
VAEIFFVARRCGCFACVVNQPSGGGTKALMLVAGISSCHGSPPAPACADLGDFVNRLMSSPSISAEPNYTTLEPCRRGKG